MHKKRGQAWGFDLMIATIIFLSGIVVFYLYSLNYHTEAQETLDSLFYEGNTLAQDLLSPGYPENWNTASVEKIGITSDGKVNKTKLESFYNLSTSDYEKTISLLDIHNDYFINFSEQITLGIGNIDGVGKQPEDPENIIKITRVTIFNEKPTSLNVFIWN